MRKTYTMTQEQYDTLLAAMQPVPYMIIGGVAPRSQQENANDAWKRLGDELGHAVRSQFQPIDLGGIHLPSASFRSGFDAQIRQPSVGVHQVFFFPGETTLGICPCFFQ